MQTVQSFRDLGLTIPGAIRAALQARALSVKEFACRYGLRRQDVSRAIGGKETPTDRLVDALVAELGGDRLAWRTVLHEAGKPEFTGVTQ